MSTPFLNALLDETAKLPYWNLRQAILGVYRDNRNAEPFRLLQAGLLALHPDADRLALTYLLDHTGRQEAIDRLQPRKFFEGDELTWLLAAWVATRPAPGAPEAVAAELERLADPWPEAKQLLHTLAAVAEHLGASAPRAAAPFRRRIAEFLEKYPGPTVDHNPTNRAFNAIGPLRAFVGEDAEGVALLERAVRQYPRLLEQAKPPAYAAVIPRLLADMPTDDPMLCTALSSYKYPAGIDHLLAACRQLERFGPKPPLAPSFDVYKEQPLVWPTLWCVRLAAPAAADKARASELGTFKPDTLLTAALLSPAWAPLIEPLLDWPGLAALIGWLYAHGETQHWRYARASGNQAGDEEQTGGADREAAVAAITSMGDKRWQKLGKHPVAKAKYRDGLFFARACLGENAAEVEAGFVKRNKLAVRALGLLPDEGDILQRYLALRRFAKEARQFGAQRQASETTATEDGLANLAATAGYPDSPALEWAMEGQLAQELDPTSRRWTIADYIVSLLPDAKATIAVERNGKPVKSVPPAVRQDDAYLEIKEARELLQAQWQRIQRRLESAMARGERFDRQAFTPALTTPAGRAMTPHLVLRVWVGDTPVDTVNHFTLTGEAIDPATITHYQVIHPLDLVEAGTLQAWQQKVDAAAQPFPQLCREVYTRPEQAKLTLGRPVRLGVLGEHLRRAGWTRSYDEGFCRRLPVSITASLNFTDGVAIQSATDILTCDALAFYRTAPDARSFSEAIRDADLATAAAAPTRPAR